jgi:tRNA(fMet)-specific endonuclease VapC
LPLGLYASSDAVLCTSVVVDAELQFGLQKNPAPKLRAAYDVTMAALDAQGTPTGPNDLLIAAHTRALGATLVTDNEDTFKRVAGLRIDNWLR